MRIAFLLDAPTVGGGYEYVRQLTAGLGSSCESRVFYSVRGECSARVINAWHPDIIHVNHLRALVQLFKCPWRHPCVPIVFTVHGIHLRKYDFLPKTVANFVRRSLRLMLERLLYRRCARIIALTKTDADSLLRVYHIQTRVCVVPNGVAESCAYGEGDSALVGQGGYAFISIARFNFPKGQDVLLRAIAKVQSELRARRWRTLLIGGGETFQAMQELAGVLGIGDLVVFAGEIPEAVSCMMRGRIVIAPSRWEGLPLMLCEAGRRKKFVIASDCPGNRDIIEDGSSGLLFPVENVDALAELLRVDYSDEAVARYGAALFARVNTEFSVEQMVSKTRAIYEDCLMRKT